MIKRERFTKYPLPIIPESAEFMLNGRYARINIETDLLDLYMGDKWTSTQKTYSEYNEYYEKTTDELYLREYVLKETRYLNKEKNIYFYYDHADDAYFCTYNKPVEKGFKTLSNGARVPIIKSGERKQIFSNKHHQIINLIEILNNNFDLYNFEDHARASFEFKNLASGTPLSEYDTMNRYYGDYNDQRKYEKFIESYYNEVLGIELTKEE